MAAAFSPGAGPDGSGTAMAAAFSPGAGPDGSGTADSSAVGSVAGGSGMTGSGADPGHGNHPPLRTEPVSGPADELTSHTTVRTPACQAFWLG